MIMNHQKIMAEDNKKEQLQSLYTELNQALDDKVKVSTNLFLNYTWKVIMEQTSGVIYGIWV